jgi:hypothetical protein
MSPTSSRPDPRHMYRFHASCKRATRASDDWRRGAIEKRRRPLDHDGSSARVKGPEENAAPNRRLLAVAAVRSVRPAGRRATLPWTAGKRNGSPQCSHGFTSAASRPSSVLYADGKVLTALYRAHPGDPNLDKTTGELTPLRAEPDASLHFEGTGDTAWGHQVGSRRRAMHRRPRPDHPRRRLGPLPRVPKRRLP